MLRQVSIPHTAGVRVDVLDGALLAGEMDDPAFAFAILVFFFCYRGGIFFLVGWRNPLFYCRVSNESNDHPNRQNEQNAATHRQSNASLS